MLIYFVVSSTKDIGGTCLFFFDRNVFRSEFLYIIYILIKLTMGFFQLLVLYNSRIFFFFLIVYYKYHIPNIIVFKVQKNLGLTCIHLYFLWSACIFFITGGVYVFDLKVGLRERKKAQSVYVVVVVN